MKVEIKLLQSVTEPYACIYTSKLTDEITNFFNTLENISHPPITAKHEDTLHILSPEDIYMVRMEDQQLMLYTQNATHISNKKLYEVEMQLGSQFLRISKTTLVNLKQLDRVEPSFNGTMCLILKNGCKDYISRKYLPAFKNYLGL